MISFDRVSRRSLAIRNILKGYRRRRAALKVVLPCLVLSAISASVKIGALANVIINEGIAYYLFALFQAAWNDDADFAAVRYSRDNVVVRNNSTGFCSCYCAIWCWCWWSGKMESLGMVCNWFLILEGRREDGRVIGLDARKISEFKDSTRVGEIQISPTSTKLRIPRRTSIVELRQV